MISQYGPKWTILPLIAFTKVEDSFHFKHKKSSVIATLIR